METNGVDDDHCKNCTENLLFPHNQMEPRVEDDGLASDHAIPAKGDDRDCDIVVQRLIVACNKLEEFEEESEGMEHTTVTRYQK